MHHDSHKLLSLEEFKTNPKEAYRHYTYTMGTLKNLPSGFLCPDCGEQLTVDYPWAVLLMSTPGKYFDCKKCDKRHLVLPFGESDDD